MRKVLLIFVLSMISTGLLYSKVTNSERLENNPKRTTAVQPDQAWKDAKVGKTIKSNSDFQGTQLELENIWNQYMANNKHSPVAYEPISGLFYVTLLDIARDPNDENKYGDMAVLYNINMADKSVGSDTTRMNLSTFEYYNYPSIAVTNPLKSDSREDHMIYTHFTFWDIDPDNPGFIIPRGARVYISSLEYGYGRDYRDIDPFPYVGPEENNADDNNYVWNAVDLISVDNGEDESSFYFASVLLPEDSNQDRYGAFGVHGYDALFGNKYTDQVPENMGFDDFRYDAGNASFYGNTPCLGSDSEGHIYFGTTHFFNAQIEYRVPGVAKSTDNGQTWSEFNIVNQNLLSDYAADNGFGDIQFYANVAYQIDGFKVTSPDNYSFVFRADLYETAGGDLSNVHVLEAMYKDGEWSIHFIADLATAEIRSFGTNTTDPRYLGKNFSYEANSRGHEVELALTADGKYEVVKWIDENRDHMSVMPDGWADLVQYSNGSYVEVTGYDTVYACDIYMSWKEVGSTEWNGPFNVTNDETNSIYTYMPDIVPSTSSVPMLMLKTFDYEGDDRDGVYRDLPDVFEQYIAEKVTKVATFLEVDATQEGSFGGKTLATNLEDDLLQFQFVGTTETKTKKVDFVNTGGSVITITDFETDGDTDAFEFSAGQTPLELGIGESVSVEVKFSPTEVGKMYNAQLYLLSDAENNDDIVVNLQGMGVVTSVYEENSELIDITINPNPISETGSIELKINGDAPQTVKMSLYNTAGQNLGILYDGNLQSGSSRNIEIKSEDYPSGSYNLFIEIDGKIIRKTIAISK